MISGRRNNQTLMDDIQKRHYYAQWCEGMGVPSFSEYVEMSSWERTLFATAKVLKDRGIDE